MELAGSEEKIRALFRELKRVDQHVAPEFIRVWNRAQATSPGSSRIFRISLAVATTLLVITLSSLVLWSQNWQRSEQPNPAIATGPTTPGSTPAPRSATPGPTLPGVFEPPHHVKSRRWDRKVAARRHADLNVRDLNSRKAPIRETVSISNWQSPTAKLLQSPADHVLTSLPQLDCSLTNLKTFLPNTPSYQNRER